MKKTSYTFLLLMLLSLSVQAQRYVLTSQSKDYPYERAQWTEAEAQAWQDKYGPIIGVNCPYPSCSAFSQEQALGVAAGLGYNSVRMWPDGGTDADGFIASVEEWARIAALHGMTISPVFSFSPSWYAQTDKTAALKSLEKEVRAVIDHFRGDDRIVMWDLWNEPEMNSSNTPEIMNWIAQMATWCQQEGCTQAISCSLVWDGGVALNNATASGNRLLRENTEMLMDVHNYHDYSCNDSFGGETASMVNRLKKLGNRPMIATECNTRVNGSTIPRSLVDFAKYNINFYTWGLYMCDCNWTVKWERSAYYNYEPSFHNTVYADGEPINEGDLPFLKYYAFGGDFNGTPTGAEDINVWSTRRAWRRMIMGEKKGIYCESVTAAIDAVKAHAGDALYNTVCLKVPYYLSETGMSSSYKTQFDNLLSAAEAADMTVLPILLTDADMKQTIDNLSLYAYRVISNYYYDKRIQGWCVFMQTGEDAANATPARLRTILRKARYAFPNQPMFLAPQVNEGTVPDATGKDVTNTMWKLSDVTAINAESVDASFYEKLTKVFQRPIFQLNNTAVTADMQRNHVNWYTSAKLDEEQQKDYAFSTYLEGRTDGTSRMEAWKAWRWVDRKPVCGVYYNRMATALTQMTGKQGTQLPYNSVCVLTEANKFISDSTTYYARVDSVLKMAEAQHQTVILQLISDTYFSYSVEKLQDYVQRVLRHYATDERILGWDLYYKVCAGKSDLVKGNELVDSLFAVARRSGAQQPVFMTPSVSCSTLSSDFDVVAKLVHGGWCGFTNLTYGSANVSLCYKIWCQSDIISYACAQTYKQMGILTAVANRFGRPIFCCGWDSSKAGTVSSAIDIFKDQHVSWFSTTEQDESTVKDFRFTAVSTQH